MIESFNHTIDIWIDALGRYSFTELCAKPSATSWSLGQMYQHLIDDTHFYKDHINICITNNENADGEMSSHGKEMFLNNSFPDERLEGSPENSRIPQPENKDHLMKQLTDLKREMNAVATLMVTTKFHGKTKHPGLSYFSAGDWLQFADMHLRHHLRQRKRLDEFLRNK